MLVVMMVLLIASLTAMTVVSIERSKDTKVNGAVLVDKSTGAQIQCANTDFLVVDGKMVSRASSQDLTSEVSVTPLVTANYKELKALRSNATLDLLDGTDQLTFFETDGDTFLTMQVHGMRQSSSAEATNGYYLHVYTSLGELLLDDITYYYKTDPTGAYEAFGIPLYTTGARRLQTIRPPRGQGSGNAPTNRK